MTNKTTSAIDLVERVADFLNAFKADPFSTGEDKAERLIEIVGNGSADTITRLQAALESAVATLRRTHDDIMLGCEREDTLTNINAKIRNLRSSVGGE